jgi:GTP-binding protein
MFLTARFLAASDSYAGLPSQTRGEVAFLGRSNAGKSSALNALTGRRKLARVSRTPGRTRQFILFEVGEGLLLVDLPGYGYARVPGELKQQWNVALSEYLQHRPQLVGLVLVMDARHPLTASDRQLLEWLRPSGRPIHALLTKADKLTREQAARALRTTQDELQRLQLDATVQLFSSTRRQGVEEAIGRVAGWLGIPLQEQKKPPVKGD